MRTVTPALTAGAVFFYWGVSAEAQRGHGLSGGPVGTPAAAMVARAIRATQAPKLDGLLDDPIWRTATPISGFVQRDPNEGQPGTEPTLVRVAYTDDALWIAVRSDDSKAGEIAALLSRRDECSPSDEVTVMIDSDHDRRTAYGFTVNAAGVKRDTYYYADSERDDR